ncbi:DUF3987 domain-containing protein [Rhodopila sp.]|uniref:DUF3987 domain-containing protein n=1 Tax=Rhodopila sp. TaxID=2480087 RepID=UPI003D134EB0
MKLHKIPPMPPKPNVKAIGMFPAELLQVEGLLGLFMAECDRSAPKRRQPIYALAMALCVVGALAGRRYRSVTNLRTNIYVAVLGESSSGKGHAQTVASGLLSKAGLSHYMAGEFQSGSGLTAELVEHPVRLSINDEFGLWLQSVTGDRVPLHRAEIKKKLMVLFSCANGIHVGNAYADRKMNVRRDIHEPHLCLFGAGTPDHFYNALQSGALRDGFIPRFLLFQPDEWYPTRVKAPQMLDISDAMIEAAQTIAGMLPGSGNLGGILQMQHDCTAVALTVPYSADGAAKHDERADYCEAITQRGCVGYSSKELVGKWEEHAIKLAMIRAISRDPLSPVMDAKCVEWGWRVAEHCISTINGMAYRHIADNQQEADHKMVRNIISEAGSDGIMKRDVIRRTSRLDVKRREMIITSLIDGGEVMPEKIAPGAAGGRPGFRYKIAD